MNRTMSRSSSAGDVAFPALLVFASLAVVLSATVYAQRQSQNRSAGDPVTYGERVGTATAPAPKVTLRLTFDNGEIFKVTQCDDAPIRVTRNGSTVLIDTQVDSQNPSQVHAKIFKHFPVKAGEVNLGESIAEVASVTVSLDASAFVEAELACKIEVIRIVFDNTHTNLERDVSSRVHPMAQGECCVTCGGYTVCACAVEGSCASCCRRPCCPLYS